MDLATNEYSTPANSSKFSLNTKTEQNSKCKTTGSNILGYTVVGIKIKKILVSLDFVNGVLILEGCYFLKAVFGCVSLFGYTVQQGIRVPVFSARHRSLLPIIPTKGTKILEESDIKLIERSFDLTPMQLSSLHLNVGSPTVLLELTAYHKSNLSNVLKMCGVRSLLMDMPAVSEHRELFEELEKLAINHQKVVHPEVSTVNEWYRILRGPKLIVPSLAVEHILDIPSSWSEAANELKKNIGIFGQPYTVRVRIMVIGEKSVGKSTFVTYLINSFISEIVEKKKYLNTNFGKTVEMSHIKSKQEEKKLSKSTSLSSFENYVPSSVCCLDIDPGQPLQNCPGVLSLRSYSQPLLGAAYTYSVATAISKAEKDHIKHIYLRRQKIISDTKRANIRKTVRLKRLGTQNKCKHPKTNSKDTDEVLKIMMEKLEEMSILKDDEQCIEVDENILLGNNSPNDCQVDYIGIAQKLMRTYETGHEDKPLIVNTMGWLSGTGLVILANLMKIIKPTHVLYLCDEEHEGFQFNYENLLSFMAGTSYTPIGLKLNEDIKYSRMRDCQIVDKYECWELLSPMRHNSGKVNSKKKLLPQPTPAHLRDLIFLSYFSPLWSTKSGVLSKPACKASIAVDWRKIAIYDMRKAWSDMSLSNCLRNTLFALCYTDEKNIQTVDANKPKRFNSDIEDILKSLWHDDRQNSNLEERCNRTVEPVMNLHKLLHFKGWAIVKKVDEAKHTIHLLSPRQEETMDGVNVLVKCKLSAPDSLIKLLER